MKKKIIMVVMLVAVLMIGILIGGCSTDNPTSVKADSGTATSMKFLGYADCDSHFSIEEYCDTETGVHYFGHMGVLTPRYNADGTLYTD